MTDRYTFTMHRPINLLELRAAYPDLFYRQDWYVDEAFADAPLPAGRYWVNVMVEEGYRGVVPGLVVTAELPSAVLCAT